MGPLGIGSGSSNDEPHGLAGGSIANRSIVMETGRSVEEPYKLAGGSITNGNRQLR